MLLILMAFHVDDENGRALRMTRTKPPGNRDKFTIFVAYTFQKNSRLVSSRDFSTIEYMIRQGTKTIEMYENPALRDCFLTTEMVSWAQENQSRIAAMRRAASPQLGVAVSAEDVVRSDPTKPVAQTV